MNKRRMKTIPCCLFLAALGALCLLSACAPQLSVEESNRLLEEHGTPVPPNVALMPEFTPDIIRNLFDRDRRRADALYGGKWMKIRGTLCYGPTNEGFGGLNMCYVGLESKGKRMAFLFFGTAHRERLAGLKHGRMLVIAGTYVPEEKHVPKLIGCTLVSAE